MAAKIPRATTASIGASVGKVMDPVQRHQRALDAEDESTPEGPPVKAEPSVPVAPMPAEGVAEPAPAGSKKMGRPRSTIGVPEGDEGTFVRKTIYGPPDQMDAVNDIQAYAQLHWKMKTDLSGIVRIVLLPAIEEWRQDPEGSLIGKALRAQLGKR